MHHRPRRLDTPGSVYFHPESHGLHHELGVHARNYSDFPLWDILMGTFVNLASFDGDVGFAGEAPRRIGALLLFRDVNPPKRRQETGGPALTS